LNDDLVKNTEYKITKAAFEKHSALKLYPKGTLLIAMYGATIGKTGILDFDACTNQACCALGDSEVLMTKFVYYWFFVNRPNIVRLSYGGGQPNISQDVIKQLRIQTPPLEEQAQIVSFLDTQSAKITRFIQTKQRLIELLKE
jgi:type I restriction enzyme S subunit